MKYFLVKEVINPICYILAGILIYYLISRIILRTSKIKVKGENLKKKKTILQLINNILKYVIGVIVVLMILEVYNVNTTAILTSLGLVGLVIGFALQDLVKDFIAGISIIFDDQYNIGDVVTINSFRGEVIALGLKSTKIKSYDGDILCISNGKIDQVINHTTANSFAKVEVDVSYDENLDHVIEVLNQICESYAMEEKKLKNKIDVLGVTNLGDNGIRILLKAETVPEEQFRIERNLRKIIKDEFDKQGINIPYPQVVVHNGKRV